MTTNFCFAFLTQVTHYLIARKNFKKSIEWEIFRAVVWHVTFMSHNVLDDRRYLSGVSKKTYSTKRKKGFTLIELSFGQISSITVKICSKTSVKRQHAKIKACLDKTKSIYLLDFSIGNVEMLCRNNKDKHNLQEC